MEIVGVQQGDLDDAIIDTLKAFASKNGIGRSILDALGMGIGFAFALVLIAAIREVLGDGKLMGYMVFGPNFKPMLMMILAPGAFITMGLLMGFFNIVDDHRKKKASAE